MDPIIWFLALVGHLGIWCAVFNGIHATAWPRSKRKLSEKAILCAVAIPILGVIIQMFLHESIATEQIVTNAVSRGYFFGSIIIGVVLIIRWVWRRLNLQRPAAVTNCSIRTLNIASEFEHSLLHGTFANLLGWFPLNEVLKLSCQRMTFRLNVAPEIDGLKIAQLSDLHFTGQIGIEYFQRVVEESNRFEPDLVFITGDIVDEVDCLDWLESTLGKLEARLGVFYVLGNHDLRIKDEHTYRQRLASIGLQQAAGRWTDLEFGGSVIRLTGNALPWYRDAEELETEPIDQPGLRVLLSHSPDQLEWAKRRGFELMFAGHTHGGQIAFPIIGPVIAPSEHGVRYASGTFQIGKMLMHVSRGISGDEPIRFLSPPELGLFTIQSDAIG